MKNSIILRGITLCWFALFCATSAYCAPVGRMQRSMVMTPEEKQAYEQRRAAESQRRSVGKGFDATLETALANPGHWAREFIMIYEMPDWQKQYTSQQIAELVASMSDFLSVVQQGDNPVAQLKALRQTLPALTPRIQKAFKPLIRRWKEELLQTLAASYPLEFVATTANILGVFDDPFEFAGTYGGKNDEVRDKVFDAIVSKEAIVKNLPKEVLNAEIARSNSTKEQLLTNALSADKNNGPTLKEIVPPVLFNQIKAKLEELHVPSQDINSLEAFINKYGDQKIFYFMRNNPPDLIKLEKDLKDEATEAGVSFNLPVLSSKTLLTGKNTLELKQNLMNALFTQKVLQQANPTFIDKADGYKVKSITVNIDKFKNINQYLGDSANIKDLYAFCTPAGLIFFYWLYQALIFDLLEQDTSLTIADINAIKTNFANSLGNENKRAQAFKEKLIASNSIVLFTQEVDKNTRDLLMKDNLFLSLGKQNTKDGTVVFLKSDSWEPEYEIIPFHEYGKYKLGNLNALLATHKNTLRKFLLISGHGSPSTAKDARDQIELAAKKLELLQEEKAEELFIIIGIDANTKKKDDVEAFQELLNKLGFVSTHVGPTTIKRRMVTVQHNKAGLYAIDEEDYLIVKNGQLFLTNETVGFGKPGVKADPSISLPNIDNQSDHYAVSATVQSKEAKGKGTTTEVTPSEQAMTTEEASLERLSKKSRWRPVKGGKLKRVNVQERPLAFQPEEEEEEEEKPQTMEPAVTEIQQLEKQTLMPKQEFSEQELPEKLKHRSAFKQEGSPKKQVQWADVTGGELAEDQEPPIEEEVTNSPLKVLRSKGG